jgi:hypothetical protein
MAKIKSTPNLPASSRMQMPSGGGPQIKNALKGDSSASAAKKVLAGAKSKGMKGC